MVGNRRVAPDEVPTPATMVKSPADVDPPEHVTRNRDYRRHAPAARRYEPEPELSPLKRDLLARLAEGVKNPRPTLPVDLGFGARNTAGNDPADKPGR